MLLQHSETSDMAHHTVRHHDLHEQSIFASPDAAISRVRAWWLSAISIRISGDKLPSSAQALDYINEESISDACILVQVTEDEKDANIIFAGAEIEKNLEQEVSGRSIMELDIPYADKLYFLDCYKKTLSTNNYLGCHGYYEYPDGSQRTFDCAFFPLTDGDDRVRCVLGIVHYQKSGTDVSHRPGRKVADTLAAAPQGTYLSHRSQGS